MGSLSMNPLHCSRILTPQNYSQASISHKDNPTLEMWKFAAQYSFFELEAYCQLSTPFVAALLKAIVSDPTWGLIVLSWLGISLDVLNQVVIDLIARTIDNPRMGYWLKQSCRLYCGGNVCQNCKDDGWDQIGKDCWMRVTVLCQCECNCMNVFWILILFLLMCNLMMSTTTS